MAEEMALVPRHFTEPEPLWRSYPLGPFHHAIELACPHGMIRRVLSERERTRVRDWETFVDVLSLHIAVDHADIYKCDCAALLVTVHPRFPT